MQGGLWHTSLGSGELTKKGTAMSIWILAADSGRARIFSTDTATGPLKEVQDLVHPEARVHPKDTASDEPGSTYDRVGQGRHPMGKAVDPKEQEAIRFAKEVCQRLDGARNAGEFDKLYVVAAPAFLGVLREAMSEPTRRLVAGEVSKNLAAHRPEEIRSHLPERL